MDTVKEASIASIETVDDCDGLKFQHGPKIETGIEWNNSSSVLQVSNDHDLLFIASSTVKVYKCSKLLSSLLDDQDHTPQPIKHIDVEFDIKRLRIKGNILAIQGYSSLVLYDFTKWKVVKRWDHKIVDFQWLNDSVVCIDGDNVYLCKINGSQNVPESGHNEHSTNPFTHPTDSPSLCAGTLCPDGDTPLPSSHEDNSPEHIEANYEKSSESAGDCNERTGSLLEDILSAMTFGNGPFIARKNSTDLDVCEMGGHENGVNNGGHEEDACENNILVEKQDDPSDDASQTVHVEESIVHQGPIHSSMEHQTLLKQHNRSSLVRHMYSLDYQTSLDKLRTSSLQEAVQESPTDNNDHPSDECSMENDAKHGPMNGQNGSLRSAHYGHHNDHYEDSVHNSGTVHRVDNGRQPTEDWLTESEGDWTESSGIVSEAVEDPHHELCPSFSLYTNEKGDNTLGGILEWNGMPPHGISPLYSGQSTQGDDHDSTHSPHSENSTNMTAVVKVPLKSEVISPEYEGYIASCISNPPSIARINEESFKLPNGISHLPIKLPDLSDLESAIVVGCALLPDDCAAVSLVVNSQDTLICIVKFEVQTVATLCYAYNELYLLDVIDPNNITSRIESLWIPSWETLMLWSGNSTQVVMMSKNKKLTGDAEWNGVGTILSGEKTDGTVDNFCKNTGAVWKVLMMQEGYCLESTDGDMGTRGLSFSVHFRESLYRKNACADTPLLVNPPVFLLAQMDGVVSVHYADVWSRQGEVKVLDESMGIDRGSYSEVSRTEATSVVSIEDIHLYPPSTTPKDSSIDTTPRNTNGNQGESVAAIPSPGIGTISASLTNREKIEKLYNDTVTRLWSLEEENETKLEAIKLFEAFYNTLDAFEEKLASVCDTDVPSSPSDDHMNEMDNRMNEMDNRISKWRNEVKLLEEMQEEMMETIQTFECSLKPAPCIDLPLEHKMLKENARKLATVSTDCSVDLTDFSIEESEDIIEGIYESLLQLDEKLKVYEKQVDDLELDLIFKRVKGSRSARGSLLPLSSLHTPILQGTESAKERFEELLDTIEQISMRDVSISLENLRLEKGHEPRFKRYQDLKAGAGDIPRSPAPEEVMVHQNGQPATPRNEQHTIHHNEDHITPQNGHSTHPPHPTHSSEPSPPQEPPQPTLPTNETGDSVDTLEELAVDVTKTASSVMDTESAFDEMKNDDHYDDQNGITENTGTSGVSTLFSSSAFNTAGSIFGTDRPAGTQPSAFGGSMFSAPVTYTFGQQNDVLMGSNLGSSGTGTSVFSSFASNTSFADLAASKCTQPPTGSFTGMSGFTSGNFNPSSINFSSVQGLFGTNLGSTTSAFSQLGQQTGSQGSTMSGDLWTRARQSNPLD